MSSLRFALILVLFASVGLLRAGDFEFHGYGELHYNAPEDGEKELDLHRFVLGMHYTWDDKWSFDMEVDFEHAFEEPEFEFLHLDYAYHESLNFRAGLILMPMGMLNQNHEPPLFFSVERPYVEKYILPTSWQEPGFGAFGHFGQGFDYQAYIISSVAANGDKGNGGIRGWRTSGGESPANDVAFTGRLTWSTPGLTVGTSLFSGNVVNSEASEVNSSMFLYDVDFHFRKSGFDVRGTYATSHLSDAAKLNQELGWEGAQSAGEDQYGYYLTCGYNLLKGRAQRLMPFVRFEKYDTQDGVPVGFENDPTTERQITTVGVSFYPRADVVIKADYEDWDITDGDAKKQFNLGIGFQY